MHILILGDGECHNLANPKTPSDHDRPLSKNGRADAVVVSQKLQQMGWIPQLILLRLAALFFSTHHIKKSLSTIEKEGEENLNLLIHVAAVMPFEPGKHLPSCRSKCVVLWKQRSILSLVFIPLQPWMDRLLNISSELYASIQGMKYLPSCQFLFCPVSFSDFCLYLYEFKH